MKTTKIPTKKPARKAPAKPLQSRLSRAETANLVMQAQEAYHYQSALNRVEPGTKFDDWRRDQVMDCVGKPGISKISRPEWKTVKAHFLALAGRDDEAFTLLTQTGPKSYRPVDGGDTWETCEQYAALVRSNLAAHAAAVVTHPKGIIHEGWFLAAARQRTGKPTLTMATLAERLDPRTLHGLLSHLRSHIATREGRSIPATRRPRLYPSTAESGDISAPF